MIELLSLYKGALITGVFCAMALALHGCHMASRGLALQSLVVSQAAIVGVLLGSVSLIGHNGAVFGNALPLLSGIGVAAFCYFLAERLAAEGGVAKTNFSLLLFIAMLALSYWLVSYFPALESHMSQAFFGDVVTLNGTAMWVTAMVSVAAMALLIFRWKQFVDHSFALPVIGPKIYYHRSSLHLFNALTLLLITTSIYSMGLLFTLAFLLVPTVIFSYINSASVKYHMIATVLLAALSMVLGFVLSLYFDRTSTVPTVVLSMLAIGASALVVVNFRVNWRR